MADLRDADLYDAHLQAAVLAGAKFGGAALGRAKLHGANLAGADLRDADLTGAKFGLNIIDAVSIDHATFSQDAFEWLILRDDWAKVKDTVTFVDN